jgi:DNA polymerase II small subunit
VISAFVPKEIDSMIVKDEVIGINGKKKGNMIMVKNVVRPELPIERKINFSAGDNYVAFLSDLHVGSKSFLRNEWDNFIRWINGKNGDEKQREIAQNIRYIVMSGDMVDGIGIYPGQENDLVVEDIYGQYECLAKMIAEIPSDKEIIMQPGNHDAVRSALPQPSFEKEITKIFDQRKVIFIGNPSYVEIDGVSILLYHGQSIQDFATCLPGMNQNQPTKIMREMLKRRHLAPVYGGISSIAPEKNDYLIVSEIPDIFVTGHVHVTAVETYRNILLINASAWMAQTEYQKMMNLQPDPAKAVIVNLKNMSPAILNFS